MQFTSETPRTTAQIQSNTFTVPQPFATGHPLSENEAAALNQLLVENVRNNMASRIKTATEKNQPIPTQADVDTYVAEYEFGMRRGATRTLDPVEREMHAIARDKVKEHLRQKGVSLKDVPVKDLNESVAAVVAKNEEKLRKVAERIIKQRETIAGEAIEV